RRPRRSASASAAATTRAPQAPWPRGATAQPPLSWLPGSEGTTEAGSPVATGRVDVGSDGSGSVVGGEGGSLGGGEGGDGGGGAAGGDGGATVSTNAAGILRIITSTRLDEPRFDA